MEYGITEEDEAFRDTGFGNSNEAQTMLFSFSYFRYALFPMRLVSAKLSLTFRFRLVPRVTHPWHHVQLTEALNSGETQRLILNLNLQQQLWRVHDRHIYLH